MGRHTKREAQPTLLAVRPDTERYLPGIMAETARGLSTVFPETLLRRDPDTRRGRLPGNPPRGYHGDPHFRPGPRPPRRAGSGVRAPGWGDLPGPGRRRLPTSQTQRGEAVRRCGRAEAGRIGAMTTATSAPGQGPPSDRTHVRPPVQEGVQAKGKVCGARLPRQTDGGQGALQWPSSQTLHPESQTRMGMRHQECAERCLSERCRRKKRRVGKHNITCFNALWIFRLSVPIHIFAIVNLSLLDNLMVECQQCFVYL
ncbi:uncharacterized protein [Oryctolagus cuniculus]|uniref:uncharacterized protein isoform X2 n=1 Tax=Oryctolagus cuniculus TaxID=9986 RepID=UPI0038794956